MKRRWTTWQMILFGIACFSIASIVSHAAWSSVGTLGSGQNKTSSTTVTMTTSAAVEVGNVAVCVIAADNTAVFDGAASEVSVVANSGTNNPWIMAKQWTNNISGGATGAHSSVWYTKVTTQIASSATITVTFVAARTAKAVSCWEFGSTQPNIAVEAGYGLSNDGTDPGSMDLSLFNKEHLWIRAVAHEGSNNDSFTKTSAYGDVFSANGTTGGSAATNMAVRGEFDIYTGVSNPSDPTYTNADHASVLFALTEIPSETNPALNKYDGFNDQYLDNYLSTSCDQFVKFCSVSSSSSTVYFTEASQRLVSNGVTATSAGLIGYYKFAVDERKSLRFQSEAMKTSVGTGFIMMAALRTGTPVLTTALTDYRIIIQYDTATNADVKIRYQDTANNWQWWTGSAWSSTETAACNTTDNTDYRFMIVLDDNQFKATVFTSATAICTETSWVNISSLRSFTSGTLYYTWGDPDTSVNYGNWSTQGTEVYQGGYIFHAGPIYGDRDQTAGNTSIVFYNPPGDWNGVTTSGTGKVNNYNEWRSKLGDRLWWFQEGATPPSTAYYTKPLHIGFTDIYVLFNLNRTGWDVPTDASVKTEIIRLDDSAGALRFQLLLTKSGSSTLIQLYNNGAFVSNCVIGLPPSDSPPIPRSYTYEFHGTIASSGAVMELWENDVSICSTGSLNTGTNSIVRFNAGWISNTGTPSANYILWLDNFIVDDERIYDRYGEGGVANSLAATSPQNNQVTLSWSQESASNFYSYKLFRIEKWRSTGYSTEGSTMYPVTEITASGTLSYQDTITSDKVYMYCLETDYTNGKHYFSNCVEVANIVDVTLTPFERNLVNMFDPDYQAYVGTGDPYHPEIKYHTTENTGEPLITCQYYSGLCNLLGQKTVDFLANKGMPFGIFQYSAFNKLLLGGKGVGYGDANGFYVDELSPRTWVVDSSLMNYSGDNTAGRVLVSLTPYFENLRLAEYRFQVCQSTTCVNMAPDSINAKFDQSTDSATIQIKDNGLVVSGSITVDATIILTIKGSWMQVEHTITVASGGPWSSPGFKIIFQPSTDFDAVRERVATPKRCTFYKDGERASYMYDVVSSATSHFNTCTSTGLSIHNGPTSLSNGQTWTESPVAKIFTFYGVLKGRIADFDEMDDNATFTEDYWKTTMPGKAIVSTTGFMGLVTWLKLHQSDTVAKSLFDTGSPKYYDALVGAGQQTYFHHPDDTAADNLIYKRHAQAELLQAFSRMYSFDTTSTISTGAGNKTYLQAADDVYLEIPVTVEGGIVGNVYAKIVEALREYDTVKDPNPSDFSTKLANYVAVVPSADTPGCTTYAGYEYSWFWLSQADKTTSVSLAHLSCMLQLSVFTNPYSLVILTQDNATNGTLESNSFTMVADAIEASLYDSIVPVKVGDAQADNGVITAIAFANLRYDVTTDETVWIFMGRYGKPLKVQKNCSTSCVDLVENTDWTWNSLNRLVKVNDQGVSTMISLTVVGGEIIRRCDQFGGFLEDCI